MHPHFTASPSYGDDARSPASGLACLAGAGLQLKPSKVGSGKLNETESLAKLVAKFNGGVSARSSELKGGFV